MCTRSNVAQPSAPYRNTRSPRLAPVFGTQRLVRRLVRVQRSAFVCGVYAAALQRQPVHPADLQQAIDGCSEARYEIDMTHFLVVLEAQQRQGHATLDRRVVEARFADILAQRYF